MTREEAIELLEQKQKKLMTIYQRYLEDGGEPLQEHENWLYALNMAVEKYKQPERPKGQWVGWHTDKFVGYDEYGHGIYRHCHYYSCRKCGRRTAVKTNFCPNCGAEMER